MKAPAGRKEAQEGKAHKAKPSPRCTVCGGPVPAGVIVGTCNKPECYDAAELVDGVTVMRAAFGSQVGAVVQTICA